MQTIDILTNLKSIQLLLIHDMKILTPQEHYALMNEVKEIAQTLNMLLEVPEEE
jgi:hypothetical protein